MKRSGVRIDVKDNGTFELTYMGVFSESVPSQTLLIRSVEDLRDIRVHLEGLEKDIKYNPYRYKEVIKDE